jgi:hypothetical protein
MIVPMHQHHHQYHHHHHHHHSVVEKHLKHRVVDIVPHAIAILQSMPIDVAIRSFDSNDRDRRRRRRRRPHED